MDLLAVEILIPRSLRLWWRVVRGEAELGLVLGKFRVELLCPFVKTLSEGQGDILSQFGDAAFEDDFRCVG